VGDRPPPQQDLHRASARLREAIGRPGWPGQLLIACGGLSADDLPADDGELWLSLAAGVVSPQGPDDWDEPAGGDEELNEVDSTVAALCAIDHFDWLAVITALAVGGPGTSASAADLAAYVRDYDPEEDEPGPDDDEDGVDDELDDDLEDVEDDEFDELSMEGLFLPVTSLWQVLGAVDDDDRLTRLGWWGLPEAILRVWAPPGGPPEG